MSLVIALIVIILGIIIVFFYNYDTIRPIPIQSLLPKSAFDQTYEGQGTTYNPYTNSQTPWRSSGIPHAPITFRPDNPDNQDYGSQNIVKWDLEKTQRYYPYRHYNDYGRLDQCKPGDGCIIPH